jgi:hypothetical protein
VESSQTFLADSFEIPRVPAEKKRGDHLVEHIHGDIRPVWRRLTDPFGPVIGQDANDGLLRRQIRFNLHNLGHSSLAFMLARRFRPFPFVAGSISSSVPVPPFTHYHGA